MTFFKLSEIDDYFGLILFGNNFIYNNIYSFPFEFLNFSTRFSFTTDRSLIILDSEIHNLNEIDITLLPPCDINGLLPIEWLQLWERSLDFEENTLTPKIYTRKLFKLNLPLNNIVSIHSHNQNLNYSENLIKKILGNEIINNNELVLKEPLFLFRNDPCFKEPNLKDNYFEIWNCNLILGRDYLENKDSVILSYKHPKEKLFRVISYSWEETIQSIINLYKNIGKYISLKNGTNLMKDNYLQKPFEELIYELKDKANMLNLNMNLKEFTCWPINASFFIGGKELEKLDTNINNFKTNPLFNTVFIKNCLFLLIGIDEDINISLNLKKDKLILPKYLQNLIGIKQLNCFDEDLFIAIIIEDIITVLPIIFSEKVSAPFINFNTMMNSIKLSLIKSFDSKVLKDVNEGKFESVKEARRSYFEISLIEFHFIINIGETYIEKIASFKWPIEYRKGEKQKIIFGSFHRNFLLLEYLSLKIYPKIIIVKRNEKFQYIFDSNSIFFESNSNQHFACIQIDYH